MKNARNSNVELLRFLMMAGICIWHVLVHGLNYKSLGAAGGPAELPVVDALLLVLLVPSTNTFMLISGYYGITLTKKKLIAIVSPVYFYFFVGIIVQYIFSKEIGGGNFEYKNIVLRIEPVSCKAWWFITEYVTIMFLSPFINEGIKSMTIKKFKYILWGLLFINCFGLYWSREHTGSDLLNLLTIYLIGRYIKVTNANYKPKFSFVIWFIPTIILFAIVLVCSKFSLSHTFLTLNYCNPLIILQSLGIFLFVVVIRENRNAVCNSLGAHSLSIYLITESIGYTTGLYKNLAAIYKEYNIVVCLSAVLMASFLCIIVDICRRGLFVMLEQLIRKKSV